MFPKLERRPSDRGRKSEQAEAISALCKTYTHTVSKLLYAFAGLKSVDDADGKAASVSQALAKGERTSLMEQISNSLSGGVEKVVRHEDVALRCGVIRDLRIRFKPAAGPVMCDSGTQPSPPPLRAKSMSLAKLSFKSTPEWDDGEQQVSPLRKASSAQAVETKPIDPATTSLPPPVEDGSNARLEEPSGPPGLYERQMEWERRRQAKLQETRDEKARMEAEAAMAIKRRPSLYDHIESAMRRERRAEEDRRVAKAEEMAQEAAAAREQAEARAKFEELQRAKMQEVMRLAEEAREQAEARMREADERAREAQILYEAARKEQEEQAVKHKEELEIRDAFGDGGLEHWPMYPGKKVLRVMDGDEFDGRVSSEFRVKDAESDQAGVR
ncbi:MAG: hypothetical protein SGPRY_002816 [Prymnesium sp.]